MLTIILQILLNSIICQMNASVVAIVNFILSGSCAQVSFFEIINFVRVREDGPDADIEFSLFDEQGSFDVFLNYKIELSVHFVHRGIGRARTSVGFLRL